MTSLAKDIDYSLSNIKSALASFSNRSTVQDFSNLELQRVDLVNFQKEYAEASTLLAIVTHQELPGPDVLIVDSSAYLNGLGETVGELRRYLLDGIRNGDLSRDEEILSYMDDIYGVLVTMDYPDAITGGLRRTTDMVRGVLEKTRSDLTLIIQQKNLERRLENFKEEH